jgi:putative ABC transport system permease protein
METLLYDLRHGFRVLWRTPGITAAAVIALALGIGANTAIFSLVNAVVIRPLPYKDADRLVTLGYALNEAAPANFLDWQKQNTSFDDMAALSFWSANLSGEEEPERVQAFNVTPSFFEVLGVPAARGRTFLQEDGVSGSDNVVVLSHGLWQRRFNSDPEILGRTIAVNAKSYTVVGIMPPNFQFYRPGDLWAPLVFSPQEANRRTLGNLIVVARLKPTVSFQQAHAEMKSISLRLAQEHPATNEGVTVNMITLQESIIGHMRQPLLILLAAVGFVLLIACANVANLLLARAASREKEIAVRAALGAGRGRIVRQLLSESVLLGLIGGVFGLLLALWLIGGLTSAVPPSANLIPRSNEIAVDGWALAFASVISVLTGIAFGFAPALQLSKPDLNRTLKEESRGSAGSNRGRRLRGVLVVCGVVFSLVLLIGAGLMIKSFLRLANVNLGFDPRNSLAMQLSLLQSRYSTDAKVNSFYTEVLDKINGLPEVEQVGAVSNLPLGGSNKIRMFDIEGRPAPPPGQDGAIANFRIATPGYFDALRIRLLRGRDLTDSDNGNSPGVAIINDQMATRYFPNEDPLGKRIRRIAGPGQDLPWLEIVGIVGDVRHSSVDAKPSPEVYVPLLQNSSRDMTLVVRSQVDPQYLASTVRQQVLRTDKDQPTFNVKTMEQVVGESMFINRFSMYLLGVFAAVALVLAAVGIYGVMSYSVSQRTREIGIRVALGAKPLDVIKMVIKRGMLLALIGIGIGLFVAYMVGRFVASLLYGVSEKDIVTFTVSAVVLMLVAFISSYIPARRATRVDPIVALRYE